MLKFILITRLLVSSADISGLNVGEYSIKQVSYIQMIIVVGDHDRVLKIELS
jgi:hypothetical protein